MVRLSWGGTLRVCGLSPHSRYNNAIERETPVGHINEVGDAGVLIDSLSSHPVA